MSPETLETFTNVPVLALGLSGAGARCVLRTLSDFGLTMQVLASPEEVFSRLVGAPESLVFVGWDEVAAMLPLFLSAELDPRRTVVVVVSEVPQACADKESILSNPIVADIWENPALIRQAERKCRLYMLSWFSDAYCRRERRIC